MKSLFFLFFLLFSYAATAQFADLIKDKNVVWVAESCIDIRLDLLDELDEQDIFDKTGYIVRGGLSILKYQDTKSVELAEGKFFLANILLEAVRNKQLIVYADSLCVQPIDPDLSVWRLDTFQEIEPVSYETSGCHLGSISFESIKLFRAYQITYYSAKNNTWHSKTWAIVPLGMIRNQKGDFVAWEPLFWVKVANKKMDLNTPNTTWAVHRWSNVKENTLHLDTIKVLKKTDNNMPMLHFLDAIKTNPKLRAYKGGDWREKALLSSYEKENIFATIDTIQTIDPVTYATKTEIIQNNLDVKTIKDVKIVQEWAWDNKRKVLSVRCLGIAPLREIRNEAGEFLFNQSMFYQRFDD